MGYATGGREPLAVLSAVGALLLTSTQLQGVEWWRPTSNACPGGTHEHPCRLQLAVLWDHGAHCRDGGGRARRRHRGNRDRRSLSGRLPGGRRLGQARGRARHERAVRLQGRRPHDHPACRRGALDRFAEIAGARARRVPASASVRLATP